MNWAAPKFLATVPCTLTSTLLCWDLCWGAQQWQM